MRVHFIGIGGIGTSSLAQWFLAHKWRVSGSDSAESIITGDLRKLGVMVKIGHHSANLPKETMLVIRSQAVRPDNPEWKAARRRNLTVLTYPEAIGNLTRLYRTVAVAGAHGKSTTTALAGLLAMHANLDPTIIVGTRLRELGNGNFRPGRSDLLVLEADEYGRAFLNYAPLLAVITNIDAEHLDTYKNLAGVKKGFLKFISNIREGGTLIINRDDANIQSIAERIRAICKRNRVNMIWYSLRSGASKRIAKLMRVPGQHNVSNALAVSALGRILHVPERTILATLRSFTGTWRRMEYRGKHRGAAVYDDYAHHPTEIRATLRAFKDAFPKKQVVCVFEPHQAERLKRLWKEFHGAFQDADALVLLPIYRVAGRDNTPTRFDSEKLAEDIARACKNKPVLYCRNVKDIRNALDLLNARTPLSRSVIIMMGAGNIVEKTPQLLDQ